MSYADHKEEGPSFGNTVLVLVLLVATLASGLLGIAWVLSKFVT